MQPVAGERRRARSARRRLPSTVIASDSRENGAPWATATAKISSAGSGEAEVDRGGDGALHGDHASTVRCAAEVHDAMHRWTRPPGSSRTAGQHSTMLTARPPRAVSLYLTFMSAPVCIMVLITLSRLTVCRPSPCRASRAAVIALTEADGVPLDAGDLDQAADRVAGQSEVVLHADLGGVLDLLGGAAEDLGQRTGGHRAGACRPRPGSRPRPRRSTRSAGRSTPSAPATSRKRTMASSSVPGTNVTA